MLTRRGGRFDEGVGPVPASLSGKRALEFVLRNTANVDKRYSSTSRCSPSRAPREASADSEEDRDGGPRGSRAKSREGSRASDVETCAAFSSVVHRSRSSRRLLVGLLLHAETTFPNGAPSFVPPDAPRGLIFYRSPRSPPLLSSRDLPSLRRRDPPSLDPPPLRRRVRDRPSARFPVHSPIPRRRAHHHVPRTTTSRSPERAPSDVRLAQVLVRGG